MAKRQPFVVRGIEFKNLKEACTHFDLNYPQVSLSKSKEGYDNKRAVEMALIEGNAKVGVREFSYDGNDFSTFTEACEFYGINVGTAQSHKATHKLTVEQTLDYFLLPKANTTSATSFEYQGRTFKSIKEVCKFYDIKYATFLSIKSRKGLTLEQTLDHFVLADDYPNGVRVHGKNYPSVTHACETLDINKNTVMTLARKEGLTYQEALDLVIHNEVAHLPTSFSYDGVGYKSLPDACRQLGYSISSVRAYIRNNGATKTEALDEFKKRKEEGKLLGARKPVVYRGQEFANFKAACEHYDLSYVEVYGYRKNHNLTSEQVLDLYLEGGPTHLQKQQIEFRGEVYNSLTDICNKFDLSYETVKDLKNRKDYSLVDAIEFTLEREKQRKEELTFEGKTFRTIKAMCDYYGVDYNKFKWYRREKNLSPSEAMRYYVDKQRQAVGNA